MLPRLLLNLGVAAVAASLGGYFIRGSGYEQRHYPITLTKANGKYSVTQKSGFKLAYHGNTQWKIFNDTDDEIEFKVNNFKPQTANGCPVEFTGNTGSASCAGFATMAPRKLSPPKVYSDVISVKRRRSEPGLYTFEMVVNGAVIDPDIELERDPYSFLLLVLVAGGFATLAGWWFGRRNQ